MSISCPDVKLLTVFILNKKLRITVDQRPTIYKKCLPNISNKRTDGDVRSIDKENAKLYLLLSVKINNFLICFFNFNLSYRKFSILYCLV